MGTTVEFVTDKGTFRVECFDTKAPLTVKNFLDYIDTGFYDGTIFHRVIPDFVIQGGGYTAEMHEKETAPAIVNEADNGLQNTRGTLSMARTQEVNSATSQFFINLQDNAFLNHSPRDFGYAVFAEVVDGMEVIDAIARVETGSRGMHQDVPREPLVVTSARRVAD